jgi:hypothetical protein
MIAFHPRIRALAVGGAAIALVAIGVGGTVAASNPATLYACYDTNGNVRMSDSAICRLPGGGRLASWGTAAVPGPTGATGPAGPSGPIGPTGAPYAPTLVEWDFTVPTCEPNAFVTCPATSTTIFPAGTRLTPVSGEIDSATGSGVPTCASATLKIAVDTGNSIFLFSQGFNPAGAFPRAVGTVAARTLTIDSSLRAFLTICGTASVERPSVSGKVILQVEYPPVVIP